jgi:Tfp pilus assembly protein PilO
MASENVKNLLILMSILMLIFLAFYIFFWRPAHADVRRYQGELRDKEAELIQLERDAEDWPDTITREMLRQYEDELEQLWSLIPSEEEVAMLLDEIQTHARSADLEIISLTRSASPGSTGGGSAARVKKSSSSGKSEGESREQTKYVRVPYKISLGGGYSGLVRFLRMLEDSERLVTVVSIRAYAGEESPLDADIQFNIFYSKVGVEGSGTL